MTSGQELPQQPPRFGGPGLGSGSARGRWRYRRTGHRAFTQGRGAAGAEEFVEFPGRQHQQQAFAHRLGATALGTVKFTSREGAKLL